MKLQDLIEKENEKETRSVRTSSSGISFIGLLQVAFIVLKLCNVITWSWVWVLSPLIFSVGITLLVLVVLLIVILVANKD